MEECGCVITRTSNGASVQLCSAHGYGTEMLPVLRRFLDLFRELEVLHGPSLLAAYTSVLSEAQALLRKIDERQEQAGRAITEPLPADTQDVIDFPARHSPVARA